MVGDDKKWHLEKKVQLPVILLLIGQIVAFIWTASKFDSRVSYLETQLLRIDKLEDSRTTSGERVIRLEEQMRQTYETVRRIETKLDAAAIRRQSAEQ